MAHLLILLYGQNRASKDRRIDVYIILSNQKGSECPCYLQNLYHRKVFEQISETDPPTSLSDTFGDFEMGLVMLRLHVCYHMCYM